MLMRSGRFHAGSFLAVLAVGLHIIMACTGGRLCFRTLVEARPDLCSTGCCEIARNLAVHDGNTRLLDSHDPDCCLEQLPDYLFQATRGPGMRLDTSRVSSFAAATPPPIVAGAVGRAIAAVIHRHAQPPSLLSVQLTVLRL
jgi:hypothetical protein